VLNVQVTAGQSVAAGDALLQLEAMKMQTQISAPTSGTVRQILVAAGQQVQEGQALLTIS
jgi:biotin carboxyl carrier protein